MSLPETTNTMLAIDNRDNEVPKRPKPEINIAFAAKLAVQDIRRRVPLLIEGLFQGENSGSPDWILDLRTLEDRVARTMHDPSIPRAIDQLRQMLVHQRLEEPAERAD